VKTTTRGLVAAAALAASLAGSAAAQQRVDETRRASATGAVEVHNVAGTVTVVGWDRPEVRVTGTLGRGTERLQFDTQGGRTVVRVIIPQRARNVGGSDLQVRVPNRGSVTVSTVSANSTVSGVGGNVSAHTVSGDVSVQGSPREVEVNSKSGNVQVNATTSRLHAASVSGNVQVAGRVNGDVEAVSVSGNVQVDAAVGEVHANSVSGNVSIRSMSGRAEVNTVSGDVTLSGRQISGEFQTVSGNLSVRGDLAPNRVLTFNSHSGDISLALARGAGADVEVSTFSGDVVNEISGARVNRVSRRETRVTVGRGGPRVSVSTFSGNVKLTQQ
jgi:DUF4097 and DUF4098 domain-containing protein YvlB